MKLNFLILSAMALFSCSACEETTTPPETPTVDTTLDKRTVQETGAYQIFYKPANGITGDPMPFYNEQEGKIDVYFLTSTPTSSGIHLTKTKDFGTFEQMQSSINVGDAGSWDTGIGTGSCIKNGGQYSFFYTGFSNKTPSSVVLKATSSDGKTWTKSPSLRIEAPNGFESGEFRDPCVYFDDTRGKFVMLVGSRKSGKSAIARFESDNLNDWQTIEPLTATTSENPQTFEIETDTWIPECPDIFKTGNKWYLVFSRLNRDMHRKTFYRIADNPNGPWHIFRDENGKHETFDGLYLYAAKSVSDGTRRYISGWASTGQSFNAMNELDWGGCLVTHKIVQQASGKLVPQIPEAIDAKFNQSVEFKDLRQTGTVSGEKGNFIISNGEVVFNRNIASVKIEMTIDASQATKNFGIAFGAYENQQDTYDIRFDLTTNNQYGLPALFMYKGNTEHNFTPLIVPQNKIFNVKIILEKSLCLIYINDNVAFTNRISNMNQNPWQIFANEGRVKFENIKIYKQFAGATFGQTVIFDGEDAGVEGYVNPWWNVGQATVEVVNWLPKDAVNGSDYGATIWLSNGDDAWSGGGITLNNLDISSYSKLSVDVNKMVDGTVQVELQNGEARAYLQLPYTAAIVDGHGSWQTLVFDIPEGWTTLTALLIAPHLVNTTENPLPDGEAHRFSWDNVKVYSNGLTVLTVSEDTEISTSETYSNITVNAGKKLTVAGGATLTANTITLKSDAANSTATFVINDGGTANITTANVEQYLAGKTGDSGREWWYVSSPVTGAKTTLFNTGGNRIGYYTETTTSYTDPIAPEENLAAGRGYVLNLAGDDAIYTFTGALNNGAVSVPVSRTGTTAAKRGFNLVGNPYPSYLDWDGVTKTNVQSTIWTRTYEGTEMAFKTYNADAQTGSDDQTTAHIAPLQAFWVKVLEDKADIPDLMLDFANAQRLHKGASDGNLRAAQAETQGLVRLEVSNGTNKDQAVLVFNENAGDGLNSFDSEKMSNNNAAIPEIYTLEEVPQGGFRGLVINSMNAVPQSSEIALGFNTGTTGSFTVQATTVSNIDSKLQIILKDKMQGVDFDLTNGEAYTFTSDAVNTESRFAIVFAPQITTGIPENPAGKIQVYVNNGKLLINNGKLGDKVAIFNLTGQKLCEETLNGKSHMVNRAFAQGVYLVKVGNDTVKVIVKQ